MNNEIDVRHVAPAIRVPTLVIHRTGDSRVNVEAGRYLGSSIPGAKYVELPGSDHVIWTGDTDRIADEVQEFLTGSRSEAEPDRVLATVLFTDIVGSTERASELGDRRWQGLLEQHNQLLRRELNKFLATFDGPARAVRCATSMIEVVRPLDIQVRGGVHTGEIEITGDD